MDIFGLECVVLWRRGEKGGRKEGIFWRIEGELEFEWGKSSTLVQKEN